MSNEKIDRRQEQESRRTESEDGSQEPGAKKYKTKGNNMILENEKKNRCGWEVKDPLYINYHDIEWGTPIHDDQMLFEFLILESFQAGLSWITVLRKRENFREAFENFDPKKVAQFDQNKIEELMGNSGIIRNLKKIEACINNAKRFLEIQKEFGSFDSYILSFVNGKPIINSHQKLEQLPSKTPLSETIAKEMKKRGFKFLGPTVIYSHLQATGVINDHLTHCFRYKEINQIHKK